MFESSVFCFVRVFCRGGGACFARWFCSGVGAFVVFCSDVFLGRPLKCFVRVRGLKTSVPALHHTLCSEHEKLDIKTFVFGERCSVGAWEEGKKGNMGCRRVEMDERGCEGV